LTKLQAKSLLIKISKNP